MHHHLMSHRDLLCGILHGYLPFPNILHPECKVMLWNIDLIMSLSSLKYLFSLALGIKPKIYSTVYKTLADKDFAYVSTFASEPTLPAYTPFTLIPFSFWKTVILILEARPLAYSWEHSFSSLFAHITFANLSSLSSEVLPQENFHWPWIRLNELAIYDMAPMFLLLMS